jgi:hypothetical protein
MFGIRVTRSDLATSMIDLIDAPQAIHATSISPTDPAVSCADLSDASPPGTANFVGR